MPSYAAAVDIAAPAETVHALVADMPRHAEWADDPLEVEPLGDGRFRTRATSRGRELVAEVQLVEAVAPTRVVLRVEDPTGRWLHTFTITPTASGCRVERVIDGDLSLGQSALYWAVLLPIKRPSNARSLEHLRRLAEAG